jgi:vacuolar-type H+-ATPase subunit F/Vma7
MDRVPVVLTGRLAATAWRLAGARARIVTAETCAAAFDEACVSSPLVLVDAAIAALLPPARLAAARRADRPLVLIVPAPDAGTDVRSADRVAGPAATYDGPAVAVPDVVDVVRRALGVAS